MVLFQCLENVAESSGLTLRFPSGVFGLFGFRAGLSPLRLGLVDVVSFPRAADLEDLDIFERLYGSGLAFWSIRQTLSTAQMAALGLVATGMAASEATEGRLEASSLNLLQTILAISEAYSTLPLGSMTGDACLAFSCKLLGRAF